MFLKSKLFLLGAVLAASSLAVALWSEGSKDAAARPPGPAGRAASCLGRLVPGEKVIEVAGPYTVYGPPLVQEVFVRRGERVAKGAPIARLQNYSISEAQLRQAQAEEEVAARLLEQVQAGEKTSAIAAQESSVLRFEAELKNAETFLRRDRELFQQKAISQNDLDRSELAWQVAQKNHDQAASHLESLKEVRSVDVRVAQARLRAAAETVSRIRAELDQAVIRAPVAGTILEIRAYPGERLSAAPVVEMGEVDQMNIEAEVDVTDIRRVRLGAEARARGEGFDGEISGTVTEISPQVSSSALFPVDPASFSDRRVVKVRIKVREQEKAAALVNHQVSVVIAP